MGAYTHTHTHAHTHTHTHILTQVHRRNVMQGEHGLTGEATKKTESEIPCCGILCRAEFLMQFFEEVRGVNETCGRRQHSSLL